MINEKNNVTMNDVQTQKLTLDSRKELKISGVSDIDSFSESEIILVTNMGRLTVKGEKLHINRLNVDTGDFSADGRVSSLCYTKNKTTSGSGFFERLFK